MKFVHRILALIFFVPLVVIALSGIALVFRGQISDMGVPGPTVALDASALGARLEALQAEGAAVSSLWTAGGRSDRFDLYLTADGEDRVLTLDGAGAILRETSVDGWSANVVFDRLAGVHGALLLGDVGGLIVAAAGVALTALIVIGAFIAWPKPGMAARVLAPRWSANSSAAWTLNWHRALGLWFAPLALFVALSGAALSLHEPIKAILGVAPLPTPQVDASVTSIRPGDALQIALDRYPGAALTMLAMPEADAPWYRIRLLAPGESRKVYGATTLLVSAADGAVLAEHDARRSTAPEAFSESLYALHSGHALGQPGKLAVALIGAWLVAMAGLGLSLYVVRRWRNLAGGAAQTGERN